MEKFGIVINFCSNEKYYLNSILSQCSIVTNNIVVSYGSHTYDGVKEDIDSLISYNKFKYPHVSFIEYTVDIDKKDLKGVVSRPTAYWCNLARWQGYEYMKDKVDWFLFIDGDEVPEGQRFLEWLKEVELNSMYIYKLANYWYFKHVVNQATTYEDSIVLVHKTYLSENSIFHDDERDGILKVSRAPQHRIVMGNDGQPMFHHFSWVRTRDGIVKKIKTWAHRDDIFKNANIESIVDYIYKNDDVNDCVHNYSYKKVEDIFNIGI